MKKMALALALFMVLSACNKGNSPTSIVVKPDLSKNEILNECQSGSAISYDCSGMKVKHFDCKKDSAYTLEYSYYADGSPTPKIVKYKVIGKLKPVDENTMKGKLFVNVYDRSNGFRKNLRNGTITFSYDPATKAMTLDASTPTIFYNKDGPVWASLSWDWERDTSTNQKKEHRFVATCTQQNDEQD